MWILLYWLRLMEMQNVLSDGSHRGKSCTPVQGSSESLDGCEDVRCLASLSFWAIVKCRQFQKNSEDAQYNSIYFGTSLFGKQPETNPHLTPIMTSLCKYQDAFSVLVSGQVMQTFRHIYCSYTGCRKNQLTIEATYYKTSSVRVTFAPFCMCSALY